MRFLKRDAATQLCDLIRSEQRELTALRKKLEAVHAQWLELQMACLMLAAQVAAAAQVYTQPSEPFYPEHTATLERDLRGAIAQRDSLIGDLPLQIRELETRISRRLSALYGDLGSFVSIVTTRTLGGGSRPQCSPELQAQLLAARRRAESMTDPAALLQLVSETVELVEAEEGLQFVPLMRLDKAIAAALAVGQPDPVAV